MSDLVARETREESLPMKPWRERIAEARERGAFTEEDRFDARGWKCCAVGEQRMAMPHVVLTLKDSDILGCECERCCLAPQDDTLETHGTEFNAAVRENDLVRAERLLDAIEDRALQLKRDAVVSGDSPTASGANT